MVKNHENEFRLTSADLDTNIRLVVVVSTKTLTLASDSVRYIILIYNLFHQRNPGLTSPWNFGQ